MWAYHIGSTSHLDNVEPAVYWKEVPKPYHAVRQEYSFDEEAALESGGSEDVWVHYPENENQVEYPSTDPEVLSSTQDKTQISFNSEDGSKAEGGRIASLYAYLMPPLPSHMLYLTSKDQLSILKQNLSYWTLKPKKVDVSDSKNQMSLLNSQGPISQVHRMLPRKHPTHHPSPTHTLC